MSILLKYLDAPLHKYLELTSNYLWKAPAKTELNSLLTNVNQSFLSHYKERKQEVKHSLGAERPVIILNGDDLILRYQGKRIQETYVSGYYHQLKSIAHIACLIHTLYTKPHAIATDGILKNLNFGFLSSKLRNLAPYLHPSAPQRYRLDMICGADGVNLRRDIPYFQRDKSKVQVKKVEAIREAIRTSQLEKYIPVLDTYVEILREGKSGIGSLIKLKEPLNQLIEEA